jgi:Recombination endonuclease VII
VTKAYERTKAWRAEHPDIRAYRAEEARKWRLAHPEKWKEIKARHRMKNGELIKQQEAEYQRKWRKNNPEAQRERLRRFKARREAKRIEEAGRNRALRCELCKTPALTVFDHCHLTGIFRGWICDRCNKVLGLVYDDPKLLKKMARYLEKGGKNHGKINNGGSQENEELDLRYPI